MTLEVVSFVIGGLLIATAIIGGGFEIKEIRMPKVGAGARAGALVVGSFFILLGLGIWESTLPAATDPEQATRALRPDPEATAKDPAPARPQESGSGTGVQVVPVDRPEAAPAPVPPPAPAPSHAGITGRARLLWDIYGSEYEAIIETYGQTGEVRVAYVGDSGAVEMVDQDLVLEAGPNLLFYRGSNPRYAGTSTPHPMYSPDNFRIVELQTGVWSITEICDLQGVCAPVETEALP